MYRNQGAAALMRPVLGFDTAKMPPTQPANYPETVKEILAHLNHAVFWGGFGHINGRFTCHLCVRCVDTPRDSICARCCGTQLVNDALSSRK